MTYYSHSYIVVYIPLYCMYIPAMHPFIRELIHAQHAAAAAAANINYNIVRLDF